MAGFKNLFGCAKLKKVQSESERGGESQTKKGKGEYTQNQIRSKWVCEKGGSDAVFCFRSQKNEVLKRKEE